MNAKRVAFWITTGVTALLFAVPGAALLAGVPHFTSEMARLGYPAYFLAIFGLFKIAGALVILAPGLPRLKEWAYAGMIFDTVFAALSRVAIGDGPELIIPPILIGVLVAISSQLRPDSRRLVRAAVAAT
jgi:uncharacterized membrane protein YphA (DoxX/SURF4 family)